MDWLLDRFAQAEPTQIAFVHRGKSATYGEIAAKVSEFTTALVSRGVRAGHIVCVHADYAPDVFCLILSLSRLGCIVVPITQGSVIELDSALRISGSDYLVDFGLEGLTWTLHERTIAVNNPLLEEFRAAGRAGLILFSSGSTGEPKAILHDIERVAEKFRVARSPVIAIPFLMLDHFGGINTLFAITSSLGTVVTTQGRSANEICRAIAEYHVDLLPTTPSFLTMLVSSDLVRRYDLSSLKRITYGTETMPQTTLNRISSLFPSVDLQQTYGLSEVGVLRSRSRPDGTLWVRMGGEGFETDVRDGILWIRSAYRMIGYLNAPAPFDADGWFNTQDQVDVDGEYFRILGRVTDLINVGGQKVYPTEVENVILGLPNIDDVVVVGETHQLLGQIVVARIVVCEDEPLEGLRRRVRKECSSRLAPYKVPVKVELIDRTIYSARQKKVRR